MTTTFVPFPTRRSVAGSRDFVNTEIERFAASIARIRAGDVPEHVFLEERLRMGVYGQRQDGVHMMRSKLPLGLMTAEQVDAFADIAEVYGHGVAHLTTRQDIQIHFVKLDATPDVMRALDRAEMTSKEACGNVVRNVCAAGNTGVSPDEPFDVTAAGIELTRFALRHPDGQSLGRKFKIYLSGTDDPVWNLGAFHDLGFTARIRGTNGSTARGFRVVVGGGLGAVPYEAVEYTDFLPEAELLPFVQAVLRVFAIHGEKKNRARARLKFLVAKWGIERFREEVAEVRSGLEHDDAWTAWLGRQDRWDDAPLHGPGPDALPAHASAVEAAWLRTNTWPQAQPGYRAVKVRVPRGDLSPAQLRGIAAIQREHSGDTLRILPDQALLIRWVPTDRLLAVRDALAGLDLGLERAGGLGDTVTCPGADSCKLGITSPRSLARSIQPMLDALARDPRLERLRIHVSGCPNSCAQHHIADIGFFGGAKRAGGVAAPHYMLMLGGRAGGTGGDVLGQSFGLPVMKLPASRVSEAISRIAQKYLADGDGASFGDFARVVGRAGWKELLADLAELPSFDAAPHMYREPGSDALFAIAVGKGECAGEVVDQSDLLLAAADREADTALQLLAESADVPRIVEAANDAMLQAARALLATEDVFESRPEIVEREFRARFYDNGRIFEGVGHYFLEARHEAPKPDTDRLRRLVVEAGLFVEEVHGLTMRLRGEAAFPRATKAVKAQLGDPGLAKAAGKLRGPGSWS